MRKILLKEINQRIEKKFGNKFELTGEYVNTNLPVKIKCNEHNVEFDVLPYSFLRSKIGCCPKCIEEEKKNIIRTTERRKLTTEKFIEISKEKFENKFSYFCTKFIGLTKPIEIYCNDCQKQFALTEARNHLKKAGGCPDCAKKLTSASKSLSQEEVIEKCEQKHGNTYDLSKIKYLGCRNKIEIICKKHKESFWILPYNFYGKGQGCPLCDQSHGEERIANYLIKQESSFEQEKEFDGLKDKRNLRCDFYIKKYNLIIEYNGQYHYKDYYGNRKRFLTQKHHDWLKRRYAKNNNINFLVIPYWEENKIEEILEKYLKS